VNDLKSRNREKRVPALTESRKPLKIMVRGGLATPQADGGVAPTVTPAALEILTTWITR
jgi:hypothetical protein